MQYASRLQVGEITTARVAAARSALDCAIAEDGKAQAALGNARIAVAHVDRCTAAEEQHEARRVTA